MLFSAKWHSLRKYSTKAATVLPKTGECLFEALRFIRLRSKRILLVSLKSDKQKRNNDHPYIGFDYAAAESTLCILSE